MTSSREQFEEWFSTKKESMKSCGLGMLHIRRAHDAAWSAWQASRQCIEVELPFYCEGYKHDEAIIDSLRAAGIKIKGA